jgi:oxygen-independent coproporphyrinogen-3 oxidase
LGAGAHSFRGSRRWWNLRLPAGYIEALATDRNAVGGDELLGPAEERFERIFLGLRAAAVGVAVSTVEASEFLADDLLRIEDGPGGDRLVATDRGMFLANDLAIALADRALR